MSDAAGGGGEKTYDPTPKKLEDARKKGDIAKSNEVTAAAVYAGMLLALTLVGAAGLQKAGGVMAVFLDHPEKLEGRLLGPGGGELSARVVGAVSFALAPLLMLPLLAALTSLFAQRAIVVSGEKLSPKLSRISPLANAKNKYGPTGLVEFAKSFTKLVAISATAYFVLASEISEIVGMAAASPAGVAAQFGVMLQRLLIGVTIIAAFIAFADFQWQRFDHFRKLKMSYQEVKDENKEVEGDPHFKSKRRQRAQQIVSGQMLQEVPTADVIIVNPTHVSVALKWTREKGSAPVCVAKGTDEIALRIRELAAEAGVPIHRDVATARALYDMVDIGVEIPAVHYKAVAAAIRFADEMRRKARARGYGAKGRAHDSQDL
ncbi:EscU/YscU/HrcU family type III secretion system export apparatus switch protein [Algicella marina]|uniref:Flagellar type III secretion system protein FlhB n=1 Tax=Algicella marina TaxID=2683284 RepID=A0A6P1T3X9_9RHOB|nr:flagellar type III secretion system protein FlhB [Algicella marina]QHQ36455.1 flagellar type III secretion system protein FlhB [Algicella marina]